MTTPDAPVSFTPDQERMIDEYWSAVMLEDCRHARELCDEHKRAILKILGAIPSTDTAFGLPATVVGGQRPFGINYWLKR